MPNRNFEHVKVVVFDILRHRVSKPDEPTVDAFDIAKSGLYLR